MNRKPETLPTEGTPHLVPLPFGRGEEQGEGATRPSRPSREDEPRRKPLLKFIGPNSQAPEPLHPNQPPPADPGYIPLTIPEIKHLTAADTTTTPRPPAHTTHWTNWRRRHQARSRWFHKRTRLARNIENTQVS